MRAVARVSLLDAVRRLCPEADERELVGWILRGSVLVNERRVTSPKALIPASDTLRVTEGRRYASRGGDKLAAALEAWNVDVTGRVLIDAGSSTGGFTDCLLRRGASRVYCVDVGYSLLDFELRRNPATTVMERTNVMHLCAGDLDPQPDAAVCDLSFRSLRGAARHLLDLVDPGWVIALVKPQFERLRDSGSLAFRGVVESAAERRAILVKLFADLAGEGVHAARVLRSPVRGRRGNTEYLAYFGAVAGDRETLERDLEVALAE